MQRQHAGDESRCVAVLKPQGERRRPGRELRRTGGGRFLRASVGGTKLKNALGRDAPRVLLVPYTAAGLAAALPCHAFSIPRPSFFLHAAS